MQHPTTAHKRFACGLTQIVQMSPSAYYTSAQLRLCADVIRHHENFFIPTMISIKQFEPKDKETLFSLIEELQDYLVQIDPLKRLCRLPGYGEKYTNKLLQKIKDGDGIIFIAYVENIPLGFIAGVIEKQDEVDLLECIPTKSGRVLELIVSDKHRGKNTGSLLMGRIEEYFQQKGCDVTRVEVFEPNNLAFNFYKKLGYNGRVIDMIKKFS